TSGRGDVARSTSAGAPRRIRPRCEGAVPAGVRSRLTRRSREDPRPAHVQDGGTAVRVGGSCRLNGTGAAQTRVWRMPLAQGARRRSGATADGRARGTNRSNQRRTRHSDEDGIMPVLARVSREVEAAVQRRRVRPSVRTKFQVAGLLMREERARVKADTSLAESRRAEELKRLDGIATILAKTAARDTSLLGLLDEQATVTDAARALKEEMLREAGMEVPAEEPEEEPAEASAARQQQVVPPSVASRQLANPFLAPDFSA